MAEKNNCLEHLEGKSSRIVIEDTSCHFLNNNTEPPIFILGFAGTGMIGTIVVNEIITQLKMKQIGYVLSEDLPPITVFYDGVLKHPFRIYYNQKYNIIASICEVPFVPGTYTDLARTLMSWALEMGIQDVITMQGMADRNLYVQDGPIEVYAAAEEEILNKILSNNVKRPPKGLIMGAEAAILNECLNNRLNGAVYMTPANPQIPSPEGAAAILERLGKVYDFEIDTSKLMDQGNEIKKNLLDLAERTHRMQQDEMTPKPIERNFYS